MVVCCCLFLARKDDDEDIYKDFESIYESMRETQSTVWTQQKLQQQQAQDHFWTLDADVDAAVNRARAASASLQAAQRQAQQQQLQLPTHAHTHYSSSASPVAWSASSAPSEQTTRADSRNTNQSYQMGPALVEEMTLSDLEDEISSSLMATRESNSMSRRRLALIRARNHLQPSPSSHPVLVGVQSAPHPQSHKQRTE